MCSEWRGDKQDFILVFTLCYRKILRMHVPGGWKMLSYSGTWTLEKSISQIVWLHGSWNNVAMLNARLVCGECNWRRSSCKEEMGPTSGNGFKTLKTLLAWGCMRQGDGQPTREESLRGSWCEPPCSRYLLLGDHYWILPTCFKPVKLFLPALSVVVDVVTCSDKWMPGANVYEPLLLGATTALLAICSIECPPLFPSLSLYR